MTSSIPSGPPNETTTIASNSCSGRRATARSAGCFRSSTGVATRAMVPDLPVVEDRFHVVPVGVEHERAVVARVILGALAGPAVVAVARGRGELVEALDRREVGHAERQVHILRRPVAADEGERTAAVAEPNVDELLARPFDVDADDRCHDLV